MLAVFRSPVVRNILALYGVQIAGYLVPLIALPFLARVLGPAEYGRVALAQSFALWLSLIIEYGFNLSATREVARHQEDGDALARVAAGVLGAKGLLILAVSFLSVIALGLVRVFRDHPAYLLGAWTLAVANGMTPFWYFQGVERMTRPAIINVAFRFLGIIFLFLLIRAPSDGWKVLLIYSSTTLLAHGVNYRQLYQEIEFHWPTKKEIAGSLHQGFAMFLVRIPGSILSIANSFVLGLLSGPVVVGYYSGADKIVRPVVNLLWPVTQALLPNISSNIRRRPEWARQTVSKSLFYTLVAAGTTALGLHFMAPLIVRVALGVEYEASIAVFRVLIALLPITAVVNVLGYQWLVPLGYEGYLSVVYIAAMIVNLLLAVIMVPALGALGMAWSVVIAEASVLFGVIIGVIARGIIPVAR